MAMPHSPNRRPTGTLSYAEKHSGKSNNHNNHSNKSFGKTLIYVVAFSVVFLQVIVFLSERETKITVSTKPLRSSPVLRGNNPPLEIMNNSPIMSSSSRSDSKSDSNSNSESADTITNTRTSSRAHSRTGSEDEEQEDFATENPTEDETDADTELGTADDSEEGTDDASASDEEGSEERR